MRTLTVLNFAAAFAAASLLPFTGAKAQDAYVIGVTAAMTGPAAATQAPVIEMLRLYVDRLNAKGGINAHRINLLVEDDQAEPSKAAANVTKLIRQDNVMLLINSSLSSTYGPGDRRSPARQGAAVVRRRSVPEGDASAEARSGAVLFDRVRFRLRHPGGDRRHQNGGKRAGEDRHDRHADPDLPNRHRGRAEAGRQARHGDGGYRVHSAYRRRLHAVCHQAEGRRSELGVCLCAVADRGTDIRSAAAARLERHVSVLRPHPSRG